MHPAQSNIMTLTIATALVLAMHVGLEGVDVKVEHDKNFDFRPVKTWTWNPQGAGRVVMSRTQEDDPEAMKRKAEPWIMDAVAKETAARGLKQAESQGDLTLTYYLLLSTGTSAQTIGQFLPATTAWGLPPFNQATQSLEMMNHGSLVLDLSAKDTVVWRGVAQAKISFDTDDKKREALLREGVRDLLKRYPPKR
jgi:Domain of unknown function (DUF4136)